MKYRIINGALLIFSEGRYQIKNEDLVINGNVIESVGSVCAKSYEDYEIIDAKDKLIMPGLINSHTHVYMNFMKNSSDDVPFNTWLYDKIFPIEAKMCNEDFYWSTLLGIIEMIKTGTTCYLDMHICENECAKAAADSGMRAFLGKCITGTDLYADGYTDFSKAIGEKEKYESDLLKFVLSPHSTYTCSQKLLQQLNEEAKKRNILKHIHLSESDKEITDCLSMHGKTPVKLLESIDFLDSNTIAAHCTKATIDDITVLSERNVSVATNPASNAKLGNGIAPIQSMLENNINVCLGTDSAASNNTLNMFREMGIFSLIHKASLESATDFSASTVLKCATENPAAALGMADRIGTIHENAFADLIFIDLNAPSLFPNNDVLSSLCYSANGSEVESVMVNGNFLMKNRILTTIDTEQVYYNINRISNKYF